jgi:hypothetical protein
MSSVENEGHTPVDTIRPPKSRRRSSILQTTMSSFSEMTDSVTDLIGSRRLNFSRNNSVDIDARPVGRKAKSDAAKRKNTSTGIRHGRFTVIASQLSASGQSSSSRPASVNNYHVPHAVCSTETVNTAPFVSFDNS